MLLRIRTRINIQNFEIFSCNRLVFCHIHQTYCVVVYFMDVPKSVCFVISADSPKINNLLDFLNKYAKKSIFAGKAKILIFSNNNNLLKSDFLKYLFFQKKKRNGKYLFIKRV